MKKTREELLETALQMHTDAAATFVLLASGVAPEKWLVACGEKKWTAAQVTEHLTLVYEVLLQELNGGSGMKVVTNFWQKALARWLFLPKILNSGIFPPGARAPKELRPVKTRADQQTAVAAFEELGRTFQEQVEVAYSRDPNTKLTHAYFGTYSLDNAVLLCARHVLHHSNHLKL